MTSLDEGGSERHFCFLRLNAEDNELLPLMSLIETLLIEQVLLVRETDDAITLIGNPLAGSLRVQLLQISLKRLQGLLFQVGQLCRGHGSFPLRTTVIKRDFPASARA